MDSADRPLTAADVAKLLGLSRSAVYRLPIPFYAYGSARRYDLGDVLAYKARQRRSGGKDAPRPVEISTRRRKVMSPDEFAQAMRTGHKQAAPRPSDGRGA